MSMVNRSQGSTLNSVGKALEQHSSIFKVKSPLKQKQQPDYKVDVDIKGDTVKNNLLRKRIQLLEESTKQSNTVKTTSVDTLLSGSNDNTTIIDADTNSALMALLGQSSSTDKTTAAECNYDDNLKALSDYLNSTDKPIIDVTTNGQKPTEKAVDITTTLGGKEIILRYDKSTLSAGKNLDFTCNGIDAKALIDFGGREAEENGIISDVNNTFIQIGKKMPQFKAMELNGQLGFGEANSTLELYLNRIAISINDYNTSYDGKSFFDTVINSLQKAKQSLYDDTKARNDPQKMTIAGTTKLIDYITDMFQQGKNGTRLNESNHWDDAGNILTSEFGGDNGGSLATVDDKLLSWKYEEYKKRFMAELGNQMPNEKNNALLKSLQGADGKIDYTKWFKSLMTPFKDAYHK